jgi:two-component system NtrC family response regulator
VRIVSATNASLEDKIGQGLFRGDLFYRMNAVTLRIPPLRERGGDVSLLANFFLARFNEEYRRNIRGFTEAAGAAMIAHVWPGNVRELEKRMKRAVVMAEHRMIDTADLELESGEAIPLDLDLRQARLRAEREVLQAALARSNHTLSIAARLLGISRPTLYGLMESHGIELDGARPAEQTAEIIGDTNETPHR